MSAALHNLARSYTVVPNFALDINYLLERSWNKMQIELDR